MRCGSRTRRRSPEADAVPTKTSCSDCEAPNKKVALLFRDNLKECAQLLGPAFCAARSLIGVCLATSLADPQFRGCEVPDSSFLGFRGPLYDQVHKHLRARILAGEWEHWQPLPPEVLLSQELGVSVGTVRRAMEKLMQERIVVRERGRGTFVRRESGQRQVAMLAVRRHDGELIEPDRSPTRYTTLHLAGPAARAIAARADPNLSLPIIKFERDWQIGDSQVGRETMIVHQETFPNWPELAELSADALFAKYVEQYRTEMHTVRWEVGTRPLLTSMDGLGELPNPWVIVTRQGMNANGDPLEVCEHAISLASHTFEIIQ
ncbi:MAG: GntR family transcriptional regulator [Hyphomicrobiaceae bacterium]|uniref:GntR family transcriptional regulator n=1 Tax=Pseudorhodoplanes sp. TaxID=1934341 RepID=UPI003D0F410F